MAKKSYERRTFTQPTTLLLGIDATEKMPSWVVSGRTAIIATAQALGRLLQSDGAIGGQLYVTNYRLFFESHALNWHKGSFSIFLPSILNDKNNDGWLSDQLNIETRAATNRFIVWDGDEIPKIAKAALTNIDALRTLVHANLDKTGEGIASLWNKDQPIEDTIEQLNESLSQKKANPLQALGILHLRDLF